MRNKIFLSAVAVLLVALQGCMPRGESYSLSDVHGWAKERYQSAVKDFTPKSEEVKASLVQIESLLAKLDEAKPGSDLGQTTRALADALVKMAPRAGFTSRPALGELSEQYRVLAAKENVTAPQVKLIATRTYSLLASELEGVKFSL